MTSPTIGFAAALEQLTPAEAVRLAVLAEQHGFSGTLAGDTAAGTRASPTRTAVPTPTRLATAAAATADPIRLQENDDAASEHAPGGVRRFRRPARSCARDRCR